MKQDCAIVDDIVNLVVIKNHPCAIGVLFNSVCQTDRRGTYRAIVGKLIGLDVDSETIDTFRVMTRGCAYDIGEEDPDIYPDWSTDHLRKACVQFRYTRIRANTTSSTSHGNIVVLNGKRAESHEPISSKRSNPSPIKGTLASV